MKRTFVVIIAVALICNLGLTSLASNDVAAADVSSVSQKNSSQYTIQVVGNQVQFLSNGKITKTIDTKNTKISLVASNSGGIALRLTDSSGKVRKFSLGNQKSLVVDGKLDSLTLSSNLPKSIQVTLPDSAQVSELKVSAPISVHVQGKVASLNVYHRSAKVDVGSTAKVAKVSSVSSGAVSGVSASKVAGVSSSETATRNDSSSSNSNTSSSSSNSSSSTGGADGVIINGGSSTPTPTPNPTPNPDPKPDPTPDPDPKPDPTPDPDPKPDPTPDPDPKPDPTPDPDPKPDPTPDPDPNPDPTPDPDPNPDPTPDPDPKPDPTPDPDPNPDPTPDPDPKPDPTPDPDPKPDPDPTPNPDPTPDPKPDPKPDPTPTPKPDPYQIDKISVQPGKMTVTLNRATEQPLTKSAFRIVCRGAGNDMTILNVSTTDNKTYQLSTSYYKEQPYTLYITLADRSEISKDFECNFSIPVLSDVSSERTSNTNATLTFVSDSHGTFRYSVVAAGNPQVARFAADSFDAEFTTASMQSGFNSIGITGLMESVPYTIYYQACGPDGEQDATNMESIHLAAKPVVTGDISIVKVTPKKGKISGVQRIYFDIELSKPTASALTENAFTLSCSRGDLSLGEVETTDNQHYRLFSKKGAVPFSGNTYTLTIELPNKEKITKSFYFDLQPPNLSSFKWATWKDESTAKIEISSDKKGNFYYKIYDEFPQDPSDIYATGTKVALQPGTNYITVDNLVEDKWFCYAGENEAGFRQVYTSREQIPAYTPPASLELEVAEDIPAQK